MNIKAIVGYIKHSFTASVDIDYAATGKKENQKIAVIVSYIKQSASFTERAIPVTFSIWDDGFSTWDWDNTNTPQTHWDISI